MVQYIAYLLILFTAGLLLVLVRYLKKQQKHSEGFANPKEEEEEPSVEQKQRLANIKTHIELVKLQYLRPIHAIQDDTRKGIVSDKCKGLATKAAV